MILPTANSAGLDPVSSFRVAMPQDADNCPIAFQGLKRLPYGQARMFVSPTDAPEEEKDEERHFCQVLERGANTALSKESQAVQYLALVKHAAAATRVMATGFAGPGQVGFGPTGSRRVDLCLLMEPGHVSVFQIHESGHQMGEGHEKWCRKYRPGLELVYDAATAWTDDFNRGLAAHLTASGLWKVDYNVVSECQFLHGNPLLQEWQGNTNKLKPATMKLTGQLLAKSRRVKAIKQATYKSVKFCPSSVGELAECLSTLLGEDHLGTPHWLPGGYSDTDFISESDLLEKLLDKNSGAGGFVTISGGRETVEDAASKVMGFCLQRGVVDPEELGPGALHLMRERVRGGMVKRSGETETSFEMRVLEKAILSLDSNCESDYTMVRRHFKKQITLPLEQFVWLVEKRGLTDFRIKHYIHYECRLFLEPFIHYLLQERHSLKRQGMGKSLKAETLKLVANGFYGYSLIR